MRRALASPISSAHLRAPHHRPSREGRKTATILERLKPPGGASLNDIMTVTTWQPYSVRDLVSSALGKKMGLTVVSAKNENGERHYSIAS